MNQEPIKVFWCEPTDKVQLFLRRYSLNNNPVCLGKRLGHDAKVAIEQKPAKWHKSISGAAYLDYISPDKYLRHAMWPTICQDCYYVFKTDDERQVNQLLLYRNSEGQEYTLSTMPPGAMYNASWLNDVFAGPDGLTVYVVLPNRDHWCIDQPASECSMKFNNTHKCWVRQGNPKLGDLHVDKNIYCCEGHSDSLNGKNYRVYLHNGYLRSDSQPRII